MFSYGDLFLGFYGDQAVAVKKLKDVGLNEPLAVKQRRLLDEATPHVRQHDMQDQQ